MKHQVFLFLLTFSFSSYAMDKNAQIQGIITKINEHCSRVNSHFPHDFSVSDVKGVKKNLKNLMRSPISDQEKIEIVKQDIGYLPAMVIIGNRWVLVPPRLDHYENKSTDNRICST